MIAVSIFLWTGIAEAPHYVTGKHGGKELWELGLDDIDAALTDLESGKAKLDSLPSPVLFETLLANTIEGYFSDPVYGGNRMPIGNNHSHGFVHQRRI